MSEHAVLQRLLPYVPPYWVRQAIADPDRALVGREERFYAAVLFVDISGFTPISEALSRRGREGVEELSAILEDYFTVMSGPVLAYGGEVVKFAGDSLIVIFPEARDFTVPTSSTIPVNILLVFPSPSTLVVDRILYHSRAVWWGDFLAEGLIRPL